MGRDTHYGKGLSFLLSIHPPHAGRDSKQKGRTPPVEISIHPPRAGWDWVFANISEFLAIPIHPPHAGRDQSDGVRRAVLDISIHPSRAEWDEGFAQFDSQGHLFQSTHPFLGGTSLTSLSALLIILSMYFLVFQSTNPMRGWDSFPPFDLPHSVISIHPPVRVGLMSIETLMSITISIHPPRARWDQIVKILIGCEFQSTHPVRGGTYIGEVAAQKRELTVFPSP